VLFVVTVNDLVLSSPSGLLLCGWGLQDHLVKSKFGGERKGALDNQGNFQIQDFYIVLGYIVLKDCLTVNVFLFPCLNVG
jgi:hypothetical protein